MGPEYNAFHDKYFRDKPDKPGEYHSPPMLICV